MKLLLTILLLAVFSSCKQETESNKTSTNGFKKEYTTYKSSNGILDTKDLVFDAGKIKKNTEIKQVFSFTNIGSEPVTILDKTMSCNCTSLRSSNDTIQPNQNTNLEVTIDTKDKNIGHGEATITIKTNSKRKFYLLTIYYEIIN